MTDAQAELLGRSIAAGCVCKCDERSQGRTSCPRHGRIDLYALEHTRLALAESKGEQDNAVVK